MAVVALAPCHCPGVPWSTTADVFGSCPRPIRSKIVSWSVTNSPKPGPASRKVRERQSLAPRSRKAFGREGSTARSSARGSRARAGRTLLHLEPDEFDRCPRVLLRVVPADRAVLGVGDRRLDLLLEPLLREPLERRLERRAARVLVDDRRVDDARVDELRVRRARRVRAKVEGEGGKRVRKSDAP